MALPKRFDRVQSPSPNEETGGPVAAMHRSIEGQLLTGQTTLPEWTAYADAPSPTEDAIHALSRVAGIAALAVGVIATSAAVISLA